MLLIPIFQIRKHFSGLIFPFFQMDKPRSYICRSYFLRPQCCKSQFFEDSTKNCILDLRKPRSKDQQGVLLGVAISTTNERLKLNIFCPIHSEMLLEGSIVPILRHFGNLNLTYFGNFGSFYFGSLYSGTIAKAPECQSINSCYSNS